MKFKIKVNPSILIWARESIGISPENASKEIEIDEDKLVNFEKGKLLPSYDIIQKMSHIYKRPIAAFLLSNVPSEKNLPTDFRTIRSENIGHFHEKTYLAIRKARGLLASAIELKKDLGEDIISFNLQSNLENDPKTEAKFLRKSFEVDKIDTFKTPNDALEFLIERFENNGIWVFRLSITQDNIRGFSLTDELMPVIVIKKGGEQASSKLFSLFHELGHILLRQGGLCDLIQSSTTIEKWCNELAGSILVPQNILLKNDIVRAHIPSKDPQWRNKELIDIANKFLVGPEVILRRLLTMGLTTSEFYKERHETWNKSKGFGKSTKPRDKIMESIKEHGKYYTQLALKALVNNKISTKDVADYLDLKLNQIDKVPDYLR